MKLTDIFKASIQSTDDLLLYYSALCARPTKKPKTPWVERIYTNGIVRWPKKNGFWRLNAHESNILFIGNNKSHIREQDFYFDKMSILLRAALVMAMAAVDKILHEAISYNFSELLSNGELNKLVNIPVSESYEIAIKSRERRGRGGKIRVRPGHMFKEKILVELYKKSFLGTQQLESICSCCHHNSIFTKYASSLASKPKPKEVRDRWSRLYNRRNAIAHECDMVRKEKAKKIHFLPVGESQLLDDIEFVKSFGTFLATQL